MVTCYEHERSILYHKYDYLYKPEEDGEAARTEKTSIGSDGYASGEEITSLDTIKNGKEITPGNANEA